MEGLDYFEQRGEEIYNIHKKMEEILSCNIKKHQENHVVETFDDDEGNLIKRPVHEILEADVSCEKTHYQKRKCSLVLSVPNGLRNWVCHQNQSTFNGSIKKFMRITQQFLNSCRSTLKKDSSIPN